MTLGSSPLWFGFGSYPAEFDNLDEPDNIVFDSSGGTSQRCAKAPDYLFMDGFQPKVPSKPFLGYGELIEHLADKGIEIGDEKSGVIGKKVCPEPNRNPCDKGRLHAGHSIAQQCPSAPPLHLFR